MLTRRTLLWAIPSLCVTTSNARCGRNDIAEMVAYAASEAGKDVTLGRRILPADDPAWGEAYKVLNSAPTGVAPYQVAQYFKTSVPTKFQEAWPEADANPIIVKFFWDMHDHPAGDTTPWCSAFVNWCLRRGGVKGTDDAGSQSFVNQNWGTEIWRKGGGVPTAAATGDLAIFRHQSDPAHGHVAFFRQINQRESNVIDVLGGNQLERIGGRIVHLIDYRSMSMVGDLELISIRTMKGLRST
jgi:uncharacterized protein (TIGR02594 family)